MRYFVVNWIHDHPDEPIRLVFEVNAQHTESRKLESFPDGHVEYASETHRSDDSVMLSTEPMPPIEEINSDPQFRARMITESEFVTLWRAHAPE